MRFGLYGPKEKMEFIEALIANGSLRLINGTLSSGEFAKHISAKRAALCNEPSSVFVDLCPYYSHAMFHTAAFFRLA